LLPESRASVYFPGRFRTQIRSRLCEDTGWEPNTGRDSKPLRQEIQLAAAVGRPHLEILVPTIEARRQHLEVQRTKALLDRSGRGSGENLNQSIGEVEE